MNYKIPKIPNKKIIRSLLFSTVVVVLFFVFFKTISPQESISSLPSCVGFSGTKNPGVNCTFPSCAVIASPNPSVNCLPNCGSSNLYSGPANPGVNCYYIDLPLCTATSASVSIADSGAIPSSRKNCADLIDLPLCSQLPNPSNLRNCVNECSQTNDATDTATGGHNKSCVRFCDRLPNNMTAIPRTTTSVGNCVYRACHQLDNNVLPSATNCKKTVCNMLTPDELNQSRIQNEDDPKFAEYCDGSNVKCYEFTAAQLPYTRYRYNKTMCQIHSCKPTAISCGRKDTCTGFTPGNITTDDTQNIACNNSSLRMSDGSTRYFADTVAANGVNVLGLYSQYVNIGLPLTDNALCTPVVCRPIIYTPYPCNKDNNNNPTIRNTDCDSSGDGAVCATTACVAGAQCRKDLGYCYKTVDCNNSNNTNRPECAVSSPEDSVDTDPIDDTLSWFHRPKPLAKAYKSDDPNQDYRIDGTCYSKSDLEDQTDSSGSTGCAQGGRWGCKPRIDLGLFTITLPYFHMQLGPDDRTRSPRMCDVIRNGNRGTGYGYLCGNEGNIYAKVDSSTAYHEGYIKTRYLDNGDSISTTRVCLRFKNTMRPNDATMPNSETCGSRECAISCAFGFCKGQICGYDVCRDLTVQYSDSKECAMSNDMFNSNNDNRCSAVIDDFLRLRAVQYGHRVCTFLDSKGQFAYNNMFFGSNEKLDNGVTCVSGSYNSQSGNCEGGKNTNDIPGLADKWRTILRIRYTEGNTTQNGIEGFYDKSGKFIKAQECAKLPLKESPPDTYNLASRNNTIKLFTPPLSIIAVHDKRGGSNASDSTAYSLGTTDFLYPEIVVRFGITSKTLSMGTGYSGYEVTKDPASYALGATALSTTLNGITYSAEVLIKKDVDPDNNQPLLCLYRRISNSSGYTDIKHSCVNRSLPEINNSASSSASTIGVRKVHISAITTNANVLTNGTYQPATINLKYCYDTNCTNSNVMSIINTNPDIADCDGVNPNNLEKYKICAKREKCSQLWKECMENEVAIQNNGITSSTNEVRTSCLALASQCNAKKGIASSSDSLIEQTNATAADPAAYGWHNELCITSGFETKLKQVYHKSLTTGSGIASYGKCLLDSASSAKSVCQVSNIAASDWGTNCKCLTYDPGSPAPSGYNSQPRQQTAREAGLCIDIPTPKICSAINYGGDSFNASSIDGTSYTTTNGGTVNIKHSDRTSSNVGSGSNGGHGEFPTAVVGMANVNGTCNGFWQQANLGSARLTPKMSCLDDPASPTMGKWSGVSTASDSASCVRYYCPAITTGDASTNSDNNGIYPNGLYNPGETIADSINEVPAQAGDTFGITYRDVTLGNKGASNGYAVWNQYTKTNDFLETSTGIRATSCISGYSATSLPTKKCNQLGVWKPTAGSCTRRMCNAINPVYNPSSSQDWQQWTNSRGATFGVEVYLRDSGNNLIGQPILTNGNAKTHLTPASRSSTAITPGSTRKGYCNKRLGFFQAGANQPEVDCRSDGTWSAIRNPCISSCTAITSPSANDGNATWAAAETQSGATSNTVVQGTCLSGYVKYPYSRFKDDNGQAINPVPTVNTTNTEFPHRSCGLVPVAGGGYANSWSGVSSTCVNQCPGYSTDQRTGVGKTIHQTSTFGQIEIRWNPTNGGATDIQTVGYNSSGTLVGSSNLNAQSAADYSVSGRTNGYFIVTRYCNPSTYVWSAPVVQCAGNAGVIDHASFGDPLGSNPSSSKLLSSFTAVNATITPTCQSNYSSSSAPKYQCRATTGNSNIDQYYYAMTSGSACSAITCQLKTDEVHDNSIYKGSATGSIGVDSPAITLACRDGYGRARLTDNSGSDDTCGMTVTDRSSSGPTMSCKNVNGIGKWVVSNDCSKCRKCSGSSTFAAGTAATTPVIAWSYGNCSGNTDNCYFSGNHTRSDVKDACGNGGDREIKLYPQYPKGESEISSGSSSENSMNSCGFIVKFKFSCYDGYYVVTKSSTDGTALTYHTITTD